MHPPLLSFRRHRGLGRSSLALIPALLGLCWPAPGSARSQVEAETPPAPGQVAPLFTLPRVAGGGNVALRDLLGSHKAVVVMFIATRCPYSNGYNQRMAELGRAYAGRGVAVVAINSNRTEPSPEVAEHAQKHGFGFPVLKDEGNRVADRYGARKTPEVFLLDPAGKVVYHGRIDEKYDDPTAVKSPDLKNALEAFLAGRPVPAAVTRAFGCSIKRI